MTKEFERWTEDGKRIDGLAVVEGAGGFVILPKSDGVALSECPCCGKVFSTMRSAMLVADQVYAMTRDS